jgi:subtilisin family serine protease
MIKYILLFCLITSFFKVFSQNESSDFTGEGPRERQQSPQSDQYNFVPSEVLVKFKDDVIISSKTNLKSAGISSVHQILKANGVTALEKLFPAETKLKSAQILKDPTGRDIKIPSLHNIFRITVPQLKSTNSAPTDIYKFMEELKALPEVEYAEPNFVFTIGEFKPAGREMTMLEAMEQNENADLSKTATGLVPNDPLYNSQWGIPATNIDDVWNTTTGDATSVIAILDTGVDWQHPDLAANIWTNTQEIPDNGRDDDGNGLIDDIRGWDYINNDNNPMDDNSHGTHVAGIAAAVGDNGIGIAGVNWKAKIMPLKVFQSSGKGDAATIAKAVTYAASKGATVINMSFGSYTESLTLKNALANAYATAILVAAAGNDALCIGPGFCPDKQIGMPMYPGAYSFVMGVEANKQVPASCGAGSPIIRACFSNFDQDGPVFSQYADLLNYELKAPGAGILSCVPGGNYREYSGTSMATPIVAGAVSLYRNQKPTESQELLFGSLINSISQHMDLEKALNIIPEPKLDIVSYAITDTLDGDRDGRPDAGETIELKVKVRNTWGQANNVKVGIEFGEFEDQTTATILTSEASIGVITAYATRENNINLKIRITENVSNNKDIVFNLNTWNGEKLGKTTSQLILKVENGVQVQGVLSGHHIWDGSRMIIISNNIKVDINDTLVIMPGTKILVRPNKFINIDGTLICKGTAENPISFDVQASEEGSQFDFFGFYSRTPLVLDENGNYISGSIITHTTFKNLRFIQFYYNSGLFEYNKVTNCNLIQTYSGILRNNIFENMTAQFDLNKSTFKNNIINNCYTKGVMIRTGETDFIGNYISNNMVNYSIDKSIGLANYHLFEGYDALAKNNTFVNNYTPYSNYSQDEDYDNSYVIHYNGAAKPLFYNNNLIVDGFEYAVGYFASAPYTDLQATENYWGTTLSNKIDQIIWDKNDDFTFNFQHIVQYKPFLISPPNECPAFVQEILIDNNPIGQEALGVGLHRFDIVFSRAMDTSYKPDVSFGVRFPYNQSKISDTPQWDETRKIFTVFKYIQLFTGDGINRMRVEGATDIEGFELPIDDRRFNFIISAASSASSEFIATPSLGKVKLQWNNNSLIDGLGYNLYRMEHENDSILTNPILINSTLITDTLYTDHAVTPNKKYYYYYKILRTNLYETDSSKVVSAIPFTAAQGDANGDLDVNTIDISAVVSYSINENPQPFIFGAADVNKDKLINVLDVVNLANIIYKPTITEPGPTNKLINLYLKNDTLFMDAPKAVAGLQFSFSGIESIDDIQKLPALNGFESAYNIDGETFRFIIYSLSNKNIPSGNHISLVKLKKGSGLLTSIFSDVAGNQINSNYITTGLWNFRDNLDNKTAELGQNYPNPLNESTTIPLKINEPVDEAIIRIVNTHGQEIAVIRLKNPDLGKHLIPWKAGANKGLIAYMLEIRRGNKHYLSDVKKMIVH